MTTQEFLDIAEKLHNEDQFAIAQKLAELYYKGVETGMSEMKAVFV